MNISPEYVLLGLLYDHPMHGYELHQTLMHEYGLVWHISQSQAYNILNRLTTQGMLTAKILPGEGSPGRHLLHLTDNGKKHFETWLTTPTHPGTQSIRTEFITRLAFARKIFPHLLNNILAEQESLVLMRLESLHDQLNQVQADCDANRLALELRIRSLKNIIDWLHEIAASPC